MVLTVALYIPSCWQSSSRGAVVLVSAITVFFFGLVGWGFGFCCQDFPVVCLHYLLHDLCTAVRELYHISVHNGAQEVFLWKVFV